jgi:hypothetical protein
MIHTRALASFLLAGACVVGCQPKTETTIEPPSTQPVQPPTTADQVRERVRETSAKADEYKKGAASLPGSNAQADRQLTTRQFEMLAQLLPLLSSSEMTGELRQQAQIVESTRKLLAGASMDLSTEPAVATGLRAAHGALASIARDRFAEVPEIAKSLDQMQFHVNELDSESGPMHRQVSAQAFARSADAVGKMAEIYDQRINEKKQ